MEDGLESISCCGCTQKVSLQVVQTHCTLVCVSRTIQKPIHQESKNEFQLRHRSQTTGPIPLRWKFHIRSAHIEKLVRDSMEWTVNHHGRSSQSHSRLVLWLPAVLPPILIYHCCWVVQSQATGHLIFQHLNRRLNFEDMRSDEMD